MKLLLLALPLVTAAPVGWESLVSGVSGLSSSLSTWSWTHVASANGNSDQKVIAVDDEDDLPTIWETLKADPDNFSRLVKVIEVGVAGHT